MINTCDHCCLKIENLTVRFNHDAIIQNVNLHVNCGEILAVTGPNGAGKTTLLKAILGEVPFQGKMNFRVDGRIRNKLNIGYLPQKISFDSDSPVSVSDLLSSSMDRMPVWLLKTGKTRFMVDNLLKMMDASPLADRTLGELSGGELQRILLACAIANNPEILLLDEPNTGIDAGGLKLFYRLVEHIRKIHHVSIILVSHDLPGISEIADRMIFLNKTVMAEGEPSEVMANEEFIRSFSPCLWNISGFPNAGWERRRINQMEER